MRIFFFSFLALSLTGIGLVSCKSKYDPGLTGEAILSGKVMHHDDIIPNAIVYLKFGALEFPGPDSSDYDIVIAANSDGFYIIENLNAGFYYLYSTGIDTGNSQAVNGGVPMEIRRKKSEVEMDIPVTE